MKEFTPVQSKILKVAATKPHATTVHTIAAEAGCKTTTVYAQMEDPQFREAFNQALRGRVHAEVPSILQSMTNEAISGNVQAAKVLLEITDVYEKSQKITGRMETETTHVFRDDDEMKKVIAATFPDLLEDEEDDD